MTMDLAQKAHRRRERIKGLLNRAGKMKPRDLNKVLPKRSVLQRIIRGDS